MFRRFFRIGFGGCGCALVETFREHANELFRDILLDSYKELAKWENALSKDNRLEMKENLEKLKDDIYEKKLDLKEKIPLSLDDWKKLLSTPHLWAPFENKIVEEGVKEHIKKMKDSVDVIEKNGFVLLEGLLVDSFSGDGDPDESRYLYNTYITETRGLIVDKYGKDILDSEGFNHQPELQMLPLSIQEVRDEVYKNVSKKANEIMHKTSGGFFFFVGLGGGTGTGIISPLAEKIGKGLRGYFTLGVLGGKEDNKEEYLKAQKPWFRRCFNILLALNDLIATAELDGIILVDNDILIKRLGLKGDKVREVQFPKIKDFLWFLKEDFDIEWADNAEVRRYDGRNFIRIFDDTEKNFGKILLDMVNKPGRSAILKISDVKEENFAEIIITLDKSDKGEGKGILRISDGRIYDLKVNEKEINGITMYGRTAVQKIDEELIRVIYPAFGRTACEKSANDIDWKQLKDIMPGGGGKSPIFVPCYASGDTGVEELIDEAIKKGMLAKYNYEKKDHEKADKVFLFLRKIDDETKVRKKLIEMFPNIRGDDTKIKFIKENSTKNEVLDGFKAKVTVFESKGGIKGRNKNEVLVLLRNPHLKDALSGRLNVANLFISLLDEFKNWIESSPNEKKELLKADNPLELANIKNRIKENDKIKEILAKIVKKEPEGENKEKKEEEILAEAINFLFPKDIKVKGNETATSEKREETYKSMKAIIEDKLNHVVDDALENLENHKFPLFKQTIFEPTLGYVSDKEVLLTSMLAMGEDISKRYRAALGSEVFDNFFKTIRRETETAEKKYVDIRGGNDDNFILTDPGEKVLEDAYVAGPERETLKKILDDEFSYEIKNPYDLLEKIGENKFFEFVKAAKTISFPKLLVLSLLYTRWKYVCGWANICVGDGNGDKKEFIEELSKISNFEWVANGAVIEPLELDKNAVSISNAEHLAEIIICEKEKEDKRFKEIHAGRYLGDIIGCDDLNKEAIRNELDKVPRTDGFALPDKFKLKEEGDNKLRIIDNTGNETEYYVRIENGSLKIFGEAKILGLKVKEAEGGKLKIYKRREVLD